MAKVNLDALIRREDFDIQSGLDQSSGRLAATLSISDLKADSFFFSAIRKPDFQRETNEWDSQKICGLVESFLSGDLIPAIILWKNPASYTFVIDGSHRLSALAAWINDDYGDGKISKNFYDSVIPDDQMEIAAKTRMMIQKRIGSFGDYELALKEPKKVKLEIVKKAKNLGALAVQLQWVDGDASKAEASFFKINQEAVPINKTELYLLQSRSKPSGVATRAIIRSGTGHKYWSKFTKENQVVIEKIAKRINSTLFNPNFESPVKTLDLPIAGKLYSAQTRALVLDFINIVHGITKKTELENDVDGKITISFLNQCKKIAERINRNNSGSLGLHPAIYFYSQDGLHKTASFYAVIALMMDFDDASLVNKFLKVRDKFEKILIDYDYLIQQIVRKYRSATKAYPMVKAFYLKAIDLLLGDNNISSVIDKIIQDTQFNYLTRQSHIINNEQKDFSREVKSEIFIREAIKSALRCKICKGYIHKNSTTVDHITRRKDGGKGNLQNAQIAHPYCNSTFKN